jgi:hypothetical protein
MKSNLQIILFLVIVTLTSCDFQNFEYKSNLEGINLNDIKVIPYKNYSCLGTYYMDDKPVSAKYTIDDKLSLVIFKLGKVDKVTFKANEKEGYDNFTMNAYGVNDSYYDLNFFYNSPFHDAIKSITLYSDNAIQSKIINDSITEYQTQFHEFAIRINNRSDFGLSGKAWHNEDYVRDAKVIFYNKNNDLYVLIVTPLDEIGVLQKV